MGGVVRRYIDILIIIITPLVLALFFGSSIPTTLFILKMFFRSCVYIKCVLFGTQMLDMY